MDHSTVADETPGSRLGGEWPSTFPRSQRADGPVRGRIRPSSATKGLPVLDHQRVTRDLRSVDRRGLETIAEPWTTWPWCHKAVLLPPHGWAAACGEGEYDISENKVSGAHKCSIVSDTDIGEWALR